MVADRGQYERTCELFHEVVGLPADQRESVLGRVEARLAEEVRAWLAADDLTGLLDHPSAVDGVGVVHRLLAPDDIPERIGPYRLIGRIDGGSSGDVYEAERERPRKRFALKILRVESASARARFVREADALARLHHPGIAQVFEAGVHERGAAPLMWIALELVAGARTITAYCREEELSLRERLECLRVCATR